MEHAGHEKAFRDRFWVTLALAVPVVFFSEMFQMLLDYEVPEVPAGGGFQHSWGRSSSSTAAPRSSPGRSTRSRYGVPE